MVDPRPFVQPMIEAYGDSGFRFGGTRHQGSLIITPERTLAWAGTEPNDLLSDTFFALFAPPLRIELLIVGTGTRLERLPPRFNEHFRKFSIGVEMMDTGAACRTYNLLLSEGRALAGAFLAVP